MVRRTLNLPVLLITVVIGGVAGATLYGLHQWQLGRTARGLVALADLDEKASDWLKSAEHLDRYLRLRPDDAEARVRLAVSYGLGVEALEVKHEAAWAHLRRATELHYRALSTGLKSREIELRQGLAGWLLKSGRFTDAEKEARIVLESAGQAENPQANRVLALALTNQLADGSLAGQNTKDLKLVEAVVKARLLNPQDGPLANVLAMLYRDFPLVVQAEFPGYTQRVREELADGSLNKLVADSENATVKDNTLAARAHLTRHLYRVRYTLADAQSDLVVALRLAPDSPDVLHTAAVDAMNQAQRAKALRQKQQSGEKLTADEEAFLKQAIAAIEKQQVRQRQEGSDSAIVESLLRKAIDYYEQLNDRLNKLPEFQRPEGAALGYGEAQLQCGDLDKALAIWRAGMKGTKSTSLVTFQARIAEACIEHGRLAEADEALDSVDEILLKLDASVARDQRLALGRAQNLRRASWHLQRRELAEALPLLGQVITSQIKGDANVVPTARAYEMLGTIYASQDEWRNAAPAFEQAAELLANNAELLPNYIEARIAAARAWLSASQPHRAFAQILEVFDHRRDPETAVRTIPTPDAWLVLAQAQLQIQSAKPPPRSWTLVEKALNELEKSPERIKESALWQVDFLRAEFLLAKDRTVEAPVSGISDAAAVLRAAEGRYSKDKDFWYRVCLTYQIWDLPADAERAVAQYRQREGVTKVDVAVLESRLASLRQDHARAEQIIKAASGAVGTTEGEKLRAELLRVAMASNDLTQARAILVAEHQRNPGGIAVLRRLAALDLERRDFRTLRDDWEPKLRAAGGIGEHWAHFFAAWRIYLTTDSARDAVTLRETLQDLDQVLSAQPNWAEAFSLRAMIKQRLGLMDQAVADYQVAIELGERRVAVFEQVIVLLGGLGRLTEVDRYLARLKADLPLSRRLAELASAREFREERPEDGLRIARRNVELRPKDAQAHLWLAQLLVLDRKYVEAEASLQQALELAPADPQLWGALLGLYVSTGKKDQIQSLLMRLEQDTVLPADKRCLLVGQANQALGNVEQANESFDRAAASAASNLETRLQVAQHVMRTNPQKAKEQLEIILKIDKNSTTASRMLAIVTAALGDLAGAEQLLSKVSSNGNVAAEDVRLHALLLVQQGGQLNTDRAVELLNDIVAREGDIAPTDRMLLARLYEQQAKITVDQKAIQKRLQLAEDQLTALAQVRQPDPAQLATLVQFLTRHNKSEPAATWLKALERRVDSLPKDDPNAIALVIQLQIQAAAATRSEAWLKRLEKCDTAKLRPVTLRAQVAVSLDPAAKVEALIERKLTDLLAETNTPEEKQQLYNAAGDIFVGLKRYASAEQWYRKLADAVPKEYSSLVGVVARQGRLNEAIDLCEKASQTDDSVQPALLLASALVEGQPSSDEFARAKKTLAAAMQKYPKDARLLYAIALVHVKDGNVAESVTLFRNIVEVSPGFVPALNNLAMILAEQVSDRTEALKLIDQAIVIAGQDANLLDTKGAILVYAGRSREAVPLLESSIRGANADPRHHFHLALAYRDTGNTEQAKFHLAKAIDRKLVTHVLTPTDQRLLAELRTALQL